MVKYMDMSGLGVNGYVGFSVKAKDNEVNREVHGWFTDLSEKSFSGDYTATLSFLKDSVEVNVKEEALFAQINDLRQKVLELEQRITAPQKVVGEQEDVDEVF